MLTDELSVNGQRLLEGLKVSSGIGRWRETGLRRLSLTSEDKAMRDVFVAWANEAGCAVEVDFAGNIFARRAGSDPELPAVCVGSHLDSQICGGRYDGVLGVLCGLEIVRALNDRKQQTRRAIEIVSWTNEEGARFPVPMQGSGAFTGQLSREAVLSTQDNDGCMFGEEVRRIGYAGPLGPRSRDYDTYLELHIEQGQILERQGVDVGIVTGGYKCHGFRIEFHGETAHCGPTPMEVRHNAAVGAGRIITAVDDIGWKYAAEDGKSTTSHVSCWPGIPGIISEWARLNIDFRHPNPAGAERMRTEILHAIEEQAARAKVSYEIKNAWTFGEPGFSADVIAVLEQSAVALGHAWRGIHSQAGHDAYNIATVAPAAMIFTPCVGGISHNVNEEIVLERTIPGANVLLHAAVSRANR
jgi:beta-ureidopropionase / N-carbamoyl-L-amino-acid hydrolase